MKKIVSYFAALLLATLALSSCVKDTTYKGASVIESLNYSPKTVMDTDDVTVTATISYERGGITAKIVYKVGDGAEKTVAMTGPAEGGQFTGVIPAQPSGSEVTFKVVANNKDNIEAEATGSYTVGAAPQDYTKLRINELNGNDKFIEIYNFGTAKIKLEGINIYKDTEELVWTCDNRELEPGAYLVLYSHKGAIPEGYDEALIFSSGLSAKKNVRIQLFDPSATSIDDVNIVNHPGIEYPGSFGLNADGKWYVQDTPTPGAVNIDGTESMEGWF